MCVYIYVYIYMDIDRIHLCNQKLPDGLKQTLSALERGDENTSRTRRKNTATAKKKQLIRVHDFSGSSCLYLIHLFGYGIIKVYPWCPRKIGSAVELSVMQRAELVDVGHHSLLWVQVQQQLTNFTCKV